MPPTGPAPSPRDPYPFLAAELVFAGLAGTVVNTSVTVAIAAIADDLDASISSVAVTVLLLNVAMAFLMPLAGVAVRAFGSRRVLVATGSVVAIGSLLIAVAPSMAVLGVARIAQGAGLAAIVPVSVQVTTQVLDPAHRARALGWWAASNGLGLAFAPVVGGLLIDLAGWRWVALPSVLVAIGLVVTARISIPGSLRQDPGISTREMATLGIITGTTMSAIAAVAAGAWLASGVCIVVAVVAVADARRRYRRLGALATLVAWSRERAVRRTSTGAGLQMVVNGMVQVTVPAWLVVSGLLSSGQAALVLMAMTLTMAGMGPVTGRAAAVPYGRWFRAGLLTCAAGVAALAVAAGPGPWWITPVALVVVGVGAGCLLSPSLTAFSHTDAGGNTVGLSMFNMLRLSSFAVGGLIGGAALDHGSPWTAFCAAAAACAFAALSARGGSTEVRHDPAGA